MWMLHLHMCWFAWDVFAHLSALAFEPHCLSTVFLVTVSSTEVKWYSFCCVHAFSSFTSRNIQELLTHQSHFVTGVWIYPEKKSMNVYDLCVCFFKSICVHLSSPSWHFLFIPLLGKLQSIHFSTALKYCKCICAYMCVLVLSAHCNYNTCVWCLWLS